MSNKPLYQNETIQNFKLSWFTLLLLSILFSFQLAYKGDIFGLLPNFPGTYKCF